MKNDFLCYLLVLTAFGLSGCGYQPATGLEQKGLAVTVDDFAQMPKVICETALSTLSERNATLISSEEASLVVGNCVALLTPIRNYLVESEHTAKIYPLPETSAFAISTILYGLIGLAAVNAGLEGIPLDINSLLDDSQHQELWRPLNRQLRTLTLLHLAGANKPLINPDIVNAYNESTITPLFKEYIFLQETQRQVGSLSHSIQQIHSSSFWSEQLNSWRDRYVWLEPCDGQCRVQIRNTILVSVAGILRELTESSERLSTNYPKRDALVLTAGYFPTRNEEATQNLLLATQYAGGTVFINDIKEAHMIETFAEAYDERCGLYEEDQELAFSSAPELIDVHFCKLVPSLPSNLNLDLMGKDAASLTESDLKDVGDATCREGTRLCNVDIFILFPHPTKQPFTREGFGPMLGRYLGPGSHAYLVTDDIETRAAEITQEDIFADYRYYGQGKDIEADYRLQIGAIPSLEEYEPAGRVNYAKPQAVGMFLASGRPIYIRSINIDRKDYHYMYIVHYTRKP